MLSSPNTKKTQGRKFGVVERAAFTRLLHPVDHPVQPGEKFGVEGSGLVWDHLWAERVLGNEGEVLPPFNPRDEFFLLPVPDGYEGAREEITKTISEHIDPIPIKSHRERKTVRYQKKVALDPGFQELWSRVSARTRYEGGPGKPTSRKADRAPRSDPYTYIPTGGGFLYLAVLLDIWSRRVVGWSKRNDLTTPLVTDALDMAITGRRPRRVIHHSDRGSQYTSRAFRARCEPAGIAVSMGRRGDAYDNAVAESFFATLETELLDRTGFANRNQARSAVFDYIEGFYNPHRRHSTIGYHSPTDYERSPQPPCG